MSNKAEDCRGKEASLLPDKSIMYQHYYRGDFGNKLRCWDNIEEVIASNFKGKVGLRYSGTGSQTFCFYYLTIRQAQIKIAQLVKMGVDPHLIHITEMAPHTQYGTLNAEITTRGKYGLELYYSTANTPNETSTTN